MADIWQFASLTQDRIMEFTLTGFWKDDDIARWEVENKRRVDDISANGTRSFRNLADLRQFPTQRKDVAERIGKCMAYNYSQGLVKSAHIVSDVIAKIQMRNIAGINRPIPLGQFLTRDEALKWLNDPASNAE